MKTIEVTSSAFAAGDMLPVRFTCDGDDISPPLAWSGVPEKTDSLAVICEDPDAPSGVFTHWVLYNLPRHATNLRENVPKQAMVQDQARQGRNDAMTTGYSGPCPPQGATHRYHFRVFALDAMLEPVDGMTRAQLLAAMQGHVLAEGQIMTRFTRAARRAA